MRSTTSKTSRTKISTTNDERSRHRAAAAPDRRYVAVGLGGNIGDSRAVLARAVERLEALLGALEVAPLYRTAPVSPVPQNDFLNTVALARRDAVAGSELADPRALLERLQDLEREAGRRSGIPLGPRVLDLDLLLYGDLVMSAVESEPRLIVPHPRLRQRRFVLAPICDLRPDLVLPPDGAVVRDLLAALGSEQQVEKIGWI